MADRPGTDMADILRGTRTSDFMYGLRGDDLLLGFAGADSLYGGGGDDTLRGGAGADILDGISGYADTVDHSADPRGVLVDLGGAEDDRYGHAIDGWGDVDRLSNFDVVLGSAHADTLRGAEAAETLDGGAGDDLLDGGGGDDLLAGGAGADTALFAGPAGAYVLRLGGDGAHVAVADKRTGGDGEDRLQGVEVVRFGAGPAGDGIDPAAPESGGARDPEALVDLRALSGGLAGPPEALRSLADLYIAYFDRAPDALGLLYWSARLADGMTLGEIAASFAVQPEALALYPGGGTAASRVDAAYAHLFERQADPEGRAYWIEALETGAVRVPDFMLALVHGARAATGSAADRATLARKGDIALSYAVEAGLTDVGRAQAAMAAYDPEAIGYGLPVANALIARYSAAALSPEEDELVADLAGVAGDHSGA